MAEKKIKTKFPGIVGKTFDKLPANKQKEVIKFMKTIPEYANKTVTELKKIAKKVYKKLPTRKPKKNEREPIFDPSDRILARDGDVTMVNRPSKLKADPEAMKALGGFKVIKPKDIKQNPNSKDEEDCIINIPTERSKTGRGRQIAAPIGDKLEAIKREYRKLEISMNPDDFIFQNLSKTKRGKNISYETPAMAKRLEKVLIGSGIKEKLDAEARHITLYSARHFYCTKRLEAGVDIFLLALNMGTSVNYIQKTYSHLTTSLMYQDISSGQGKRGRIEKERN